MKWDGMRHPRARSEPTASTGGTRVAPRGTMTAAGPTAVKGASTDAAWRAELARLGEPANRFPVERHLGAPLPSFEGKEKRDEYGRTPAPAPSQGPNFFCYLTIE